MQWDRCKHHRKNKKTIHKKCRLATQVLKIEIATTREYCALLENITQRCITIPSSRALSLCMEIHQVIENVFSKCRSCKMIKNQSTRAPPTHQLNHLPNSSVLAPTELRTCHGMRTASTRVYQRPLLRIMLLVGESRHACAVKRSNKRVRAQVSS